MLRSVLTAFSHSPDCAMDNGAVWALSMCRSLLLDLKVDSCSNDENFDQIFFVLFCIVIK